MAYSPPHRRFTRLGLGAFIGLGFMVAGAALACAIVPAILTALAVAITGA